MEHAKLANGGVHESRSVRSPSWTEKGQKDAARPGGKKVLRKKLIRERLSLLDRPGKRWVVSRNQTS